MTIMRRGWISDFWEQGMEGERWHTFQDAVYAETRTTGWRREGMLRLQPGDHLAIFADDGEVLWAGELAARRRHWFSRRQVFPGEPEWHPVDVAAATWQGWFQQKPALGATLERER